MQLCGSFLEEISSLSNSIVFLYFFHCSLRKAFLSLLAILWNSAFKWVYLSFSPLPLASLLFSAICKASSDNHFAFLHFFFLWIVLVTASYTRSWTSIFLHLSLSSYFQCHLISQDGRIEGHEVIFSCKNSKITTHCWRTIDRRMLNHTKKRYPTFKDKGEAPGRW